MNKPAGALEYCERQLSQLSLPLHPEMPPEALIWKEKAVHNFCAETQPSSLMDLKRRILWLVQPIFVKNGCEVLHAKEENDHPHCCQQKVQSRHLWWLEGGIMGDMRICEGAIIVEAFIGILERHMLSFRRCLFLRSQRLCQQDNSRPHPEHTIT